MSLLGNIISQKNNYVEWAVISHPMRGEEVSGDGYLIKCSGDQVLVAAVDGLGHGTRAKEATIKAIKILEGFKKQSLIHLVNDCHEALNDTRGAVMSLAVFDISEDTMAWIGVGNVEGTLFRAKEVENLKEEYFLLRGGVVGYKLPHLKVSIVSVMPGDTLILTTDGVHYDYSNRIDITKTAKEIAQFIASNYMDLSDDAQVVVVRYNGAK